MDGSIYGYARCRFPRVYDSCDNWLLGIPFNKFTKEERMEKEILQKLETSSLNRRKSIRRASDRHDKTMRECSERIREIQKRAEKK